jgi:hypothetical protein
MLGEASPAMEASQICQISYCCHAVSNSIRD